MVDLVASHSPRTLQLQNYQSKPLQDSISGGQTFKIFWEHTHSPHAAPRSSPLNACAHAQAGSILCKLFQFKFCCCDTVLLTA